MNFFKPLFFLIVLFFQFFVRSQETIDGRVTIANSIDPAAFINVSEKNSKQGTTTNMDGNFSIKVAKLPARLIFSAVGFRTKEVTVSSSDAPLKFTIQEGAFLDEIVIVGNRAKPRTVIESPVAIDNISAEELAISAQTEVDKMIAFRVPSYNSTQQTVSDATAHFDPSELRNLGPSRTLVLVNGKRKNQSALVYIQETPGRGEVGVDMKSIPAAAIERVEVLRDGASAQYGSDAIAGVINIILKEKVKKTNLVLNSGITTQGDGLTYSGSLNTSFEPKFGGYVNFTMDFQHQDYTNRAGEPGDDQLFGQDRTNTWIQENPDLGMIVGQPEYDRLGLTANAGFPYLDNRAKVYLFANLQLRDGKSFALYRAPYWIPDPFNLFHQPGTTYQGFQPTFEADIVDNSFTVGNNWEMFDQWNFDLSYTFGRNAVDYAVNNSLNTSLGANSPTNFKPGGYSFGNHIGNLDVSKSFGELSVALGTEFRSERFVTEAGEEASYFGSGVQSFPGLTPQNALDKTRSNIGVYAGLDWDISESLLFSGAGRYENYSDFGDNISWKVAGRLLFPKKKGALRASVNTAFRAPSLHQIYLSNIQTLQLNDGSIGEQGTFNNEDPVIIDPVTGLGVPRLDAETSFTLAGGLTYRFLPEFSIAVDYYRINVDDRVLFTNPLGKDGDDTTVNAVEQILNDNNIQNITFFVNAVDTETQGIDLVANYSNLPLGPGVLGINAALNWNETKINGTIRVPEKIRNAGYTDIFNREEQARITSARPNIKGILGLNYEIDKVNIALNNTYFGEVTWQSSTDPNKDQTFSGKVLTDISLSYRFSDWVKATLRANNIFDVYPDEIKTFGDTSRNLGGRFRYPWEVNQFGFVGTFVQLGMHVSF